MLTKYHTYGTVDACMDRRSGILRGKVKTAPVMVFPQVRHRRSNLETAGKEIPGKKLYKHHFANFSHLFTIFGRVGAWGPQFQWRI